MSKQILIVDLPDDGKCNLCHAMDEQSDGSMRCPVLEREITLSGINWIRPSDCPMIPVGKETKYEVKFNEDQSVGIFGGTETVTVSYTGDMGGEKGEFEDYVRECLQDWADGGTAVILRDELGLEE